MSEYVNMHKPYGPYERFVKRPLDCILASAALVCLSPVMALTAVAVRVKLGSPVIFKQPRPGKDEKVFNLYKFRTMTDERDENGVLLPDDVRLTPFGRMLRSTSLDELPELVNIAKGDMAVIGPRPLATVYLPYYNDEERHRHDVRPGLTGKAQVMGRNSVSWPERFAYDLEYVKKITFIQDASIIVQTVLTVLKRDGIGQGAERPIDFHVMRQAEWDAQESSAIAEDNKVAAEK